MVQKRLKYIKMNKKLKFIHFFLGIFQKLAMLYSEEEKR